MASYSPLDAPYAPKRLPTPNTETIMLVSERVERATRAHENWATIAKICTDFFEGEQWSAADLAKLNSEGRPALTLNKIRPLAMVVLGYHLQNRTDWKYNPGNDEQATFEVAQALNKITKNVADNCGLSYVDAEVFLDGLIGGRGYYDTRLNFENNILGDCVITATDPFSVKLDPDGDSYDLNASCGYLFTDKWLSLDEIELTFGKQAVNLVRPWMGTGSASGMPGQFFDYGPDIAPWRRFGGELEVSTNQYDALYDRFGNWVDRTRKVIRMVDMQHYKNVQQFFFVDVETGEREPIPDRWIRNDRAKIEKVMAFAESIDNPLEIMRMMTRRVRWTQMIGDVLVYDDWSIYDKFTITPFFPYFRRGRTMGMVEPLLDAQREHNKRRSARLNIIMRAAHSGWLFPKGSLDVIAKENLERNGSAAGVNIEYDSKNGALQAPKQIEPPTSPIAMKQLEDDAEEDLKKIAGVNDSALGQLDRVQSGRAIEARQRQTLVGIEPFIQNYKRSKELLGGIVLDVIQDHYPEQRAFRILGEDGKPERVVINQVVAGAIINNVTMGRYLVSVDDTPSSVSFMEAQFAEALMLREKGVPIPDDVLIELSSLGMKDSIKQRVEMLRASMGIVPGGAAPIGAASPGSAAPDQPIPTGPASPVQAPAPAPQPAMAVA